MLGLIFAPILEKKNNRKSVHKSKIHDGFMHIVKKLKLFSNFVKKCNLFSQFVGKQIKTFFAFCQKKEKFLHLAKKIETLFAF